MANIYPGMLDNSIEYFKNKGDVYMIHNGKVTPFDEIKEHPQLKNIIDNDKELKNVLRKMCGDNEFEMQKTLAKCRFGALNFTPDFTEDHHEHDFIECPMRDNCIGCNIVCKPPIINGNEASIEDVHIMKELCGNDKNSTIACKLGYKQGTFNVKKTQIYTNYNLITKQQLTQTMFMEGLL